MSKVYVAKREYGPEGFDILGIFLTEKEAREAIYFDQRNTRSPDSWDVQVFTVGEVE